MGRIILHTVMCVVLSVSLVACKEKHPVQKVDPAKVDHNGVKSATAQSTAVRIAVGGMITPKQGFAYYREFLDYMGRQLGQPVQYVDAEGYDEINHKLQRGEIDGGFVCSGPYVDGRKEFGLELVAAPKAYGKMVYFAYIIVPSTSQAKSLEDLKGRKFAFTDPLSNTGKLVPEFMLKSMGETPESFFSKVEFSGSHDRSIKAVAEGLVDGASVDSLIWDYANISTPDLTKRTRVIRKSEPYAIPPFVVRPGLDPALKEKIRTVLLNAHNTADGRAIMEKMKIEQFEVISDSAYDSIREMKRQTGKK